MGFVEIPLYGAKGGIALVSESKVHLVQGHRWYLAANGYVMAPGVGLMHRVVTNAPKGEDVDHINFVRHDNRDENLIVCSRAENRMRNRQRAHSKQPYKGVRKSGKRWSARIRIDYREIYLGTFDTPEQAALAYDAAAKKIFGQFAVLNLGE